MFYKKKCIWRLELQKRGAPHYHILIFDLPYVPVAGIQTIWYDIIKTPEELRYGNACDLQTVKGDGGKSLIMSYVAKYAAKLSEDYEGMTPVKLGRIWGCWNIEDEKPIKCVLWDIEAEEIANRVMGMWSKKYYTPDDLTRCTLFGEELGTGQFQATLKRVIEEVCAEYRVKPTKHVEFAT